MMMMMGNRKQKVLRMSRIWLFLRRLLKRIAISMNFLKHSVCFLLFVCFAYYAISDFKKGRQLLIQHPPSREELEKPTVHLSPSPSRNLNNDNDKCGC